MINKLTSVIVADSQGIVRWGVINLIVENLDAVHFLQAETFEQVLFHLQKPMDLLILDINIPGGNNVTMLSLVKSIRPLIKILIFSSYNEDMFALRYMQAGADGYLKKNSDELELIRAIQTLMDGRQYVSQKVKDSMLDTVSRNPRQALNPLSLLSNREMEVVLQLVQGRGVLETSKRMNLKMGTVSTYKARAFEKLEVGSTVELAEKFKLYAAVQTL